MLENEKIDEKLNRFEEKLISYGEKLDQLLTLTLAMIPTTKMPAKLRKLTSKAQTPTELMNLRKAEMLRLHRKAGSEMTPESKNTQNYPAPISLGEMEIVPHRNLLSRASLNRLFAPVVEHMEVRATDNAEATLAELVESGELVVARLSDTKIKQIGTRPSNALVVFSRKEYDKIQGVVREKVSDKKPLNIWPGLPKVVQQSEVTRNGPETNPWTNSKKSETEKDFCEEHQLTFINGKCADCEAEEDYESEKNESEENESEENGRIAL